MDERTITVAVVAAVFVGLIIIGRVAVARFSNRVISATAATVIGVLVIGGFIGLAGRVLLFEQIAGQ